MDAFMQGGNRPFPSTSLPKPPTLAPPPGYASARPFSLPRPGYGVGVPHGAQCQQHHRQNIPFPGSQSPNMPMPRATTVEQHSQAAGHPSHRPCPSPNLGTNPCPPPHQYSHWPQHPTTSQGFAESTGPPAQSSEGGFHRSGPRDPRIPIKLHHGPPCSEPQYPGPTNFAGMPTSLAYNSNPRPQNCSPAWNIQHHPASSANPSLVPTTCSMQPPMGATGPSGVWGQQHLQAALSAPSVMSPAGGPGPTQLEIGTNMGWALQHPAQPSMPMSMPSGNNSGPCALQPLPSGPAWTPQRPFVASPASGSIPTSAALGPAWQPSWPDAQPPPPPPMDPPPLPSSPPPLPAEEPPIVDTCNVPAHSSPLLQGANSNADTHGGLFKTKSEFAKPCHHASNPEKHVDALSSPDQPHLQPRKEVSSAFAPKSSLRNVQSLGRPIVIAIRGVKDGKMSSPRKVHPQPKDWRPDARLREMFPVNSDTVGAGCRAKMDRVIPRLSDMFPGTKGKVIVKKSETSVQGSQGPVGAALDESLKLPTSKCPGMPMSRMRISSGLACKSPGIGIGRASKFTRNDCFPSIKSPAIGGGPSKWPGSGAGPVTNSPGVSGASASKSPGMDAPHGDPLHAGDGGDLAKGLCSPKHVSAVAMQRHLSPRLKVDKSVEDCETFVDVDVKVEEPSSGTELSESSSSPLSSSETSTTSESSGFFHKSSSRKRKCRSATDKGRAVLGPVSKKMRSLSDLLADTHEANGGGKTVRQAEKRSGSAQLPRRSHAKVADGTDKPRKANILPKPSPSLASSCQKENLPGERQLPKVPHLLRDKIGRFAKKRRVLPDTSSRHDEKSKRRKDEYLSVSAGTFAREGARDWQLTSKTADAGREHGSPAAKPSATLGGPGSNGHRSPKRQFVREASCDTVQSPEQPPLMERNGGYGVPKSSASKALQMQKNRGPEPTKAATIVLSDVEFSAETERRSGASLDEPRPQKAQSSLKQPDAAIVQGYKAKSCGGMECHHTAKGNIASVSLKGMTPPAALDLEESPSADSGVRTAILVSVQTDTRSTRSKTCSTTDFVTARRAASKLLLTGRQEEVIDKLVGANTRIQRLGQDVLRYLCLQASVSATEGSRLSPKAPGSCILHPNSERCIRKEVGDNPDASKALRLLTKDLKLVERKGDGGRQDPYLYTVHKEVLDAFNGARSSSDTTTINVGILSGCTTDQEAWKSGTHRNIAEQAPSLPAAAEKDVCIAGTDAGGTPNATDSPPDLPDSQGSHDHEATPAQIADPEAEPNGMGSHNCPGGHDNEVNDTPVASGTPRAAANDVQDSQGSHDHGAVGNQQVTQIFTLEEAHALVGDPRKMSTLETSFRNASPPTGTGPSHFEPPHPGNADLKPKQREATPRLSACRKPSSALDAMHLRSNSPDDQPLFSIPTSTDNFQCAASQSMPGIGSGWDSMLPAESKEFLKLPHPPQSCPDVGTHVSGSPLHSTSPPARVARGASDNGKNQGGAGPPMRHWHEGSGAYGMDVDFPQPPAVEATHEFEGRGEVYSKRPALPQPQKRRPGRPRKLRPDMHGEHVHPRMSAQRKSEFGPMQSHVVAPTSEAPACQVTVADPAVTAPSHPSFVAQAGTPPNGVANPVLTPVRPAFAVTRRRGSGNRKSAVLRGNPVSKRSSPVWTPFSSAIKKTSRGGTVRKPTGRPRGRPRKNPLPCPSQKAEVRRVQPIHCFLSRIPKKPRHLDDFQGSLNTEGSNTSSPDNSKARKIETEAAFQDTSTSPADASQLEALAKLCGHLAESPLTANAILMEKRRQAEILHAVPPRPYRVPFKKSFTLSDACSRLVKRQVHPAAQQPCHLPISSLELNGPAARPLVDPIALIHHPALAACHSLQAPDLSDRCPPLFMHAKPYEQGLNTAKSHDWPLPMELQAETGSEAPCAEKALVTFTKADELAESHADEDVLPEASALVANLGCNLQEAIRLVKAHKSQVKLERSSCRPSGFLEGSADSRCQGLAHLECAVTATDMGLVTNATSMPMAPPDEVALQGSRTYNRASVTGPPRPHLRARPLTIKITGLSRNWHSPAAAQRPRGGIGSLLAGPSVTVGTSEFNNEYHAHQRQRQRSEESDDTSEQLELRWPNGFRLAAN